MLWALADTGASHSSARNVVESYQMWLGSAPQKQQVQPCRSIYAAGEEQAVSVCFGFGFFPLDILICTNL